MVLPAAQSATCHQVAADSVELAQARTSYYQSQEADFGGYQTAPGHSGQSRGVRRCELRYYAYFPGCSSSEGGAKAYGASAQAVGKALDIEFVELEDWNCCGSTPYSSFEGLA